MRRRVHSLKFVLMAVVIVLTLGLFWFSAPSPQLTAPQKLVQKTHVHIVEDLGQNAPSIDDVASAVMENPIFTGRDRKGRKWTIKALRGVRGSTFNGFQLTAISGTMSESSTKQLDFTATGGIYRIDEKELLLREGIVIHSAGYTAQTAEVRYNMETRTAEGPGTLTVDGPTGHMTAARFEAANQGNNLVFYNVSARLHTAQGQP